MNQFFIVGAQRSSTTWLYKMLQQHPQIAMAEPVRPEPKHFLGDEFDDNKHSYLSKYFSNVESDILACGEKSTTYIESELAAQRISTMFPEAKIIMVLRNPVERALSNYHFSVSNGLESRGICDAILNREQAPSLTSVLSTDPFDYLGRGLYKNYIDLYEKYFPKDSLLILSTENLTKHLLSLSRTYKFLGVDHKYEPKSFFRAENTSSNKEKPPEEVMEYLYDYYRDTFLYLGQYPDFER
ncbi:sulfotransferase [Vibrio sp. 10N.222.54.F12]|uniref:sulfotransferase family protein n=1 Tax=Vibrio TaxID=662 RepID=UPI0002F5CD0C|nr:MULTISPECIES: sulfotransferase [Vibrio]OEF72885.1 hypothetical protein A152_11530 [Vibrio tasmaniensis 1F-187]PML18553.1 hypothetical protein BCT83_04490 [Vibrio tasmaniensis]PML49383.1 hypothetical protein BCT76_08280 [Vibrio tasmaniensis]WKY58264.1 sulfotransferase [Vibrio sp. SNU_ST1]